MWYMWYCQPQHSDIKHLRSHLRGPVLPTNLPTNHLPRYLLVLDPATTPPTTSGTPTQRCSSLLSEDPNSTYLSNILNLLMLCNISVVEMKYWANFSQVEDSRGITPGQFYDYRISANILLLVHLEKIERSGLGGSRCILPPLPTKLGPTWFFQPSDKAGSKSDKAGSKSSFVKKNGIYTPKN